jgi:hypothetical protein
MNAFVPYLAALHQRDLLEEARLTRIAKRAQLADQAVPAWRRVLASGVRGLSGAFASAARTIDPEHCIESPSAA